MGRLIDAEKLNSEFDDIIDCLENNVQAKKTISKEEVCECIKLLRECVDEEPTAYNVEKVVEQLKENSHTDYSWCDHVELDKAIEIVRKGGAE